MGAVRVAVVAVWVGIAGLLCAAGWNAVDQAMPMPTPTCRVLVVGADSDTEGTAFNAWVGEQGATNVEYWHGVWWADGVAVGYSRAEDSDVMNHAECV